MRFVKSMCWWLIPLLVGVAIGASFDFSPEQSSRSSAIGSASVEEIATEAPEPVEPSKNQTASGGDSQPPPQPLTLDELVALATQIGYHYRIAGPRLSSALQHVGDEEIVAWHEELMILHRSRKATSGEHVIKYALDTVAQRLAEVAPEIALRELSESNLDMAHMVARAHPGRVPEFLTQFENPDVRRALLAAHLMGMSGKDAAETRSMRRKFVEEHGSPRDLKEYGKALESELIVRDSWESSHSPEELVELLQIASDRTKSGRRWDMSPSNIASSLARQFQSASAALAFAEENEIILSSEHGRNGFYSAVFSGYIDEDPEAATAWIASQPPEIAKAALAESLWSASQADPEAMSRLVDQLDPSVLPENAVGTIAWMWSDNDQTGGMALAWFLEKTNNGADIDEKYFGRNLAQIASHDPDGVSEFLASNPKMFEKLGSGVSAVARRLIRSDPEKNAALMLDNVDAKAIPDAGVALGRSFYGDDPDAARAFVATQTDPARRHALIDGITQGARNSDWNGTLAWAENLEGADRDRALNGILASAVNDPATSAEVATRWLSDADAETIKHEKTQSSISAVAKALTEFSAAEAGEWASGLPEGSAREKAIATVSESWSNFDPAGASEWLVELPSSPARDTAVANLVRNIPDDPLGAFSWSKVIDDPKTRGELMDGVINRWRRSDPAAAREAIEGATDLPEQERQQLLEKLNDAE